MVLGLGAHEGTHCLSVFGTPSKFCAVAGPLIDEARFRAGKGAEAWPILLFGPRKRRWIRLPEAALPCAAMEYSR